LIPAARSPARKWSATAAKLGWIVACCLPHVEEGMLVFVEFNSIDEPVRVRQAKTG
jgi:hypothetical protein